MSVITLCTLDVFDTGERNMQVKEGRFFRKFPTVCSLSVRRMTFMHKRNYKSEGDSHEDFFALVLFSRFFFTVLSTCYTMSWTQRAILTSKNQGANLGSVLGYRRSFLEDDYDSMLTGPLIKRGSSKRIARLNSQLVGWEDLPQWMRCKSHMTSGHRSSSTFACLRCFASLFHIHNSRGITVRERQRS